MRILSVFALNTLISISLSAQSNIQLHTSDLSLPTGLELDEKGNLWVAEAGTGQHDGLVSIILPDGTNLVKITGLPSSINPFTKEVEGTIRVQVLDNQFVAVFTGRGIDTNSGQILMYNLQRLQLADQPLTLKDADQIIDVKTYAKTVGFVESNPYAIACQGNDLFIADASANVIFQQVGETGQLRVFAKIPAIESMINGIPNRIEAVPTRIITDANGGFWVSTFSGYPHPEASAVIYHINQKGEVTAASKNWTMITDMMADPKGDGLIILEFGQFFPNEFTPVPNSGKIIHLKSNGNRALIASGFGPSGGMASLDAQQFFVSNLFEGTVVKITIEDLKSE